MFTSTDMVYDGEHAPYNAETAETAAASDAAATAAVDSATNHTSPVPVNIYGETKLAFERCVLQRLQHGTVLRLSNMIGECEYNECVSKCMALECDGNVQMILLCPARIEYAIYIKICYCVR